jgi:hypothetical protein
MYVFSIDIPFKGSQSLAKMMSRHSCACHSGVIDSGVTKIGDYKVDFLSEY